MGCLILLALVFGCFVCWVVMLLGYVFVCKLFVGFAGVRFSGLLVICGWLLVWLVVCLL